MSAPTSYRAPVAVPLAEVATAVGGTLSRSGGGAARGLRQDSRAILPGEVFVARAGERADGLDYVDQAVARGACAVLAERGHAPKSATVPLLLVDDVRLAMAQAAAVIYGEPTRALPTVGVTGTNGKTTTCSLVQSVLESQGQLPAVMGTLGAGIGNRRIDTGLNTPEADELTRIAAWLRDQGASHLLMEVTSHALAQRRTDGLCFRVAAFTNLTRDHLDLHGTMQAYGDAKERLFVDLEPDVAAVMVDDPFGASLADRARASVLRVSARPGSRADLRPSSPPELSPSGIRCAVATPAGSVDLHSPLLGAHNLENLLLALAVLIALDVDGPAAAAGLAASRAVPGRLERCDEAADDLTVFVDYAHSPDALERVLTTVRLLTKSQVICVFGCGGNRDRDKRPLMGEVVARLADVAIVTNDNPRDEAPEIIAQGIVAGTEGAPAPPLVELDRGRAIAIAIARAKPGDVVVIAGKGHETTQTVGSESVPFDDRERARQALTRRRLGQP
ncbi:MAG: UDP-N-acetylmuramoyl-L-alanyl-D-glutamate--2,6-diaminopimelate ligase [Deltaproteobacteria bacterium]|nr:UDP-N-acetylmuramoyl-L-alanyl-D-glutamate--2,6-diaminopimelate ligase [Deltaproteobacteria bacterium]